MSTRGQQPACRLSRSETPDGTVARDRLAHQRLEGGPVHLLSLVDVDRSAHVAVEARVEETRRILERRTLGEGQLHVILVGFARANDAVVRPHRSAPLPLLDNVRVGLLDELAHSAEGVPAPVAELGDSLRDEHRGRLALAFHGLPNCLAYSAFSRCQPPNFIASGPTMRPRGVPLSRRSSTSKQMCQPAAPIEMKRRAMLVHSVRRVPPPRASSCHRMSKPPQLYSSTVGASARVTVVSVTCGPGAPTVVSFTLLPTVPRLPSASNGAHSRSCAGSVSACQTFSGGWRSSRTRMSVQLSPCFLSCAPLAGPGVYCSRLGLLGVRHERVPSVRHHARQQPHGGAPAQRICHHKPE